MAELPRPASQPTAVRAPGASSSSGSEEQRVPTSLAFPSPIASMRFEQVASGARPADPFAREAVTRSISARGGPVAVLPSMSVMADAVHGMDNLPALSIAPGRMSSTGSVGLASANTPVYSPARVSSSLSASFGAMSPASRVSSTDGSVEILHQGATQSTSSQIALSAPMAPFAPAPATGAVRAPLVPGQKVPEATKIRVAPDAAALAQALAKPRLMPPPPFFLTHHVLHLTCELPRLRGCMEDGLRNCGADWEYNPAKWKAKGYIFKPNGFVNFALRAYTEVSPSGNEQYLVELQRRRGCHTLFQAVYDTLLHSFSTRGMLKDGTASAERAAALVQVGVAEAATGLSGGSASSSSGGLPPPPFTSRRPVLLKPAAQATGASTTEGDAKDASEELGYASDASDVSTASVASSNSHSGSGSQSAALDANDTAMVVDAFTTLSAMLASEFDDVACPAAQSIAALCSSKRVRRALALRLSAALDAATAHTPTSASGMATPPAPAPAPVLALCEQLLVRCANPYASIESRTASVIALQQLCKDRECARSLFRMHLPARLLTAVLYMPQCAAGAAFRRAAIQAVHVCMQALEDSNPAKVTVARSLLSSARACSTAPCADARFGAAAKVLSAHLDAVMAPKVGMGVPILQRVTAAHTAQQQQ